MPNKYKTSYKLYPAWNYKKEIEDYNKASEQGWQLVKTGCLHSRFVYNEDIRYRYQMDFQKVDDMGRYIETFREQGWEYVSSTWNNWHTFRKIYDPGLSPEAYEIFTDQESLQEMKNRWIRLLILFLVLVLLLTLFCVTSVVKAPRLPMIIMTATVFLEVLVLLRGLFVMKNPASSHNSKGDNLLFAAFLLILLLGNASGSVLQDLRPNFYTQQQTDELEEPLVDHRWMDIDIKYTDYYYFGLDIKAEEPLTFSIINEQEEVVYTITATELKKEDICIRLTPGTYDYSMDCSSGFNIYVYVE